MDIRMQGMGGLEALPEMKQRWPDMKVILMTTFEDSLQAATALERGAEGYMAEVNSSAGDEGCLETYL